MAIHTISVFDSIVPIRASGGPVLRAPINQWIGGERDSLSNDGKLSTLVSRDDLPVIVLPKRGERRIGCAGRFRVPVDFVGTALINLEWVTDAAADALQARLEVDYLALAAGESIDQAAVESVGVNAAGQDAAWEITSTGYTLTSANFAASDTVLFGVFRDHLQADPNNDTIPGPVYLVDVTFSYADV